jgi:phage terminase large subunit
MRAFRGEDTRGQVVSFLNEFRRRLSVVSVDSIGVAYNFGLHLRDCRFVVDMTNVATACESESQLGEQDPSRRFVNLKAQFYQGLADAFERDQIEGLVDETTIGQLAGILYEFDSHGRIKIESKESARPRGLPSPDRADALMLAMSRPYHKFEFIPVPTGRRLNSRWGQDSDDEDNGTSPETSRSRKIQRSHAYG